MVPLNNFWRTFEHMPLIRLILASSKDCFLVAGTAANQEPTFAMTDTKLNVPVVTLLTHDNIKLLKPLESGFKRTINWNIYQSKPTDQTQNRYLDFLIDPGFQGVNRLCFIM